MVQPWNIHPPELPFRSSPSGWEHQGTAWKVKKSRSKLFPPRMKPSNIEVLFFFFFFLAELLFPNSHRGPTAQEQIKQLQKGIYFCSGPDCTQSNLHNLPPNLNQLKCTPGDYIQKPIWKNIHCLTLKNPGERKQSGRGCSS